MLRLGFEPPLDAPEDVEIERHDPEFEHPEHRFFGLPRPCKYDGAQGDHFCEGFQPTLFVAMSLFDIQEVWA